MRMRITSIASTLAALCGSIVMLTGCGGGEGSSHLTQLEELDAALVQVQAKERADQVALAQAEASGASASTIAALQATFSADKAEENQLVQFYTLEYDGFADFPKYPTNILADVNALAGLLYLHQPPKGY